MGQNTNYQATSYQLMRELVILSINLSYVKDAMQRNERFIADLMYLNIPHGPEAITRDNLVKRKASLQKRFTQMIEFQLVEKHNNVQELLIVVPQEQAGFRKKELEQGWASIPDIYENNWLIDLRTGNLYEDNYVNAKFFKQNILPLDGVYRYFNIDINNPLPNKDIRY
jgi:hypothetical protein